MNDPLPGRAHTTSYARFRDLLLARDYAAAEMFAERESVTHPGDEAFWLTQLTVARLRAGRVAEALSAAERAVALAPANAYALIARADALCAANRVADALADYREAGGAPRLHARAHHGVLHCLARLEQWDVILEQLDAWGDADAEALEARAKALAARHRDREALDVCGRWLAAATDNPRALWLLVDLEIRRDGLETVAERYGRLARIPSRPAIYREIYASLCRRLGRDDVAIREYGKLVEAAGSPRLQRKQAFALAKAGGEAEAIPMFEQLLQDDPRDVYVHSAYTAACARARQLSRAWRFYNELLARHPQEKGLYGRLRRITRAMETAPDDEDGHDTR